MKKRTISNAYQIPPAGQWRKLISRIQRPCWKAVWIFFDMTPLHAHAQYIYIVNAKYQHKQNLYLKANRKKWLISKSCYFVKKHFFWHQTSLCKCSMSLYCVGKVLNCFGTSCGTSWIPRIYTIYTRHTKLLSYRSAAILLKGFFFCMTPLHAHAQYICIVYAK